MLRHIRSTCTTVVLGTWGHDVGCWQLFKPDSTGTNDPLTFQAPAGEGGGAMRVWLQPWSMEGRFLF